MVLCKIYVLRKTISVVASVISFFRALHTFQCFRSAECSAISGQSSNIPELRGVQLYDILPHCGTIPTHIVYELNQTV